jgi:hypothetical protein
MKSINQSIYSWNAFIASSLLFMLIMAGIAACKRPSATDEKSLREQQWKRAGMHNYEYTLRINCFCGPETTGPHLIRIQADTIVSVNGTPYVAANSYVRLLKIPDLFLFIRESDARKPFRRSVKYDSVLGYPTSVYYDFDERIADEEIGYIITDLKKN